MQVLPKHPAAAAAAALTPAGGPANGALTIATTHHSIMTGLKFDDGRVENASVEFDEDKLAPTYKLLWGVPGVLRVGFDGMRNSGYACACLF
jgi:DNA mismatch repair protein MutS2